MYSCSYIWTCHCSVFCIHRHSVIHSVLSKGNMNVCVDVHCCADLKSFLQGSGHQRNALALRAVRF